jgi:hypothetical protein
VSCLAIVLGLSCAKVNAPSNTNPDAPLVTTGKTLVQQSIGSAGGTVIDQWIDNNSSARCL